MPRPKGSKNKKKLLAADGVNIDELLAQGKSLEDIMNMLG